MFLILKKVEGQAQLIRIEPVKTQADLGVFVRLPWRLYHSDAHWVPPLILERLHVFR